MKDEPVAWMFKYNKIVDNNKPEKGDEHNWIPLYTHPAKCRCCGGYGLVGNIEDTVDCPLCHGEGFENHPADLTDEEIGELIGQYSHYENWEDFARAILRKAQE